MYIRTSKNNWVHKAKGANEADDAETADEQWQMTQGSATKHVYA